MPLNPNPPVFEEGRPIDRSMVEAQRPLLARCNQVLEHYPDVIHNAIPVDESARTGAARWEPLRLDPPVAAVPIPHQEIVDEEPDTQLQPEPPVTCRDRDEKLVGANEVARGYEQCLARPNALKDLTKVELLKVA